MPNPMDIRFFSSMTVKLETDTLPEDFRNIGILDTSMCATEDRQHKSFSIIGHMWGIFIARATRP
jgi:hypothetical protein